MRKDFKSISSLFLCPKIQSSLLCHSLKVFALTFRLSEKKRSEKITQGKIRDKTAAVNRQAVKERRGDIQASK